MSNFIVGKFGEILFEEALRKNGCIVKDTGQEALFDEPSLDLVRKLSENSPCEETRRNCLRIRKTKDYVIFFPDSGELGRLCWQIELKTRLGDFPRDLNNFLKNNLYRSELEQIFEFNPGSRYLINDFKYKTFRIIDSNKPLNYENQCINWYDSWKVIPFIENKKHWEYFYKKNFSHPAGNASDRYKKSLEIYG